MLLPHSISSPKNTVKHDSHSRKHLVTHNTKTEVYTEDQKEISLNSVSDTYGHSTIINNNLGSDNNNVKSSSPSKLEDIPVESIRIESPSSSDQQEDEVRMVSSIQILKHDCYTLIVDACNES